MLSDLRSLLFKLDRWLIPPQMRSRIVLVALLLLFVASLLVPLNTAQSTQPSISRKSGQGDVALFARVVARLERGESYYPAMGNELRAGRYPTASVFNWRTPTLYLLLSAAPRWTLVLLLTVLCLALLAPYFFYFAQNVQPGGTLVGLILSIAAAASVFDSGGRLLTEVWCGILIGLSLAAYIWRRWRVGAISALAAIFFRELAAPYCVVCVVLAVRAKRTQELRMWGLGLSIFSIAYAAHVFQVLDEIRPDDRVQPNSWVQFGGLVFWLSTITANVVLYWAPRVLVAASSVLLAAGLWASCLPRHVWGATVAYSAFFIVAGQPFNGYWGLVSALPFALSVAHGPSGLVTLVRQARGLPDRR